MQAQTTRRPGRFGIAVGDDFEKLGNRRWTAQRPYPNGVTVYSGSGSSGRGFDFTLKVAVRDGKVVGYHESEYNHRRTMVVGPNGWAVDVEPDWHYETAPYSREGTRMAIDRTALSKWIAAVKEL